VTGGMTDGSLRKERDNVLEETTGREVAPTLKYK